MREYAETPRAVQSGGVDADDPAGASPDYAALTRTITAQDAHLDALTAQLRLLHASADERRERYRAAQALLLDRDEVIAALNDRISALADEYYRSVQAIIREKDAYTEEIIAQKDAYAADVIAMKERELALTVENKDGYVAEIIVQKDAYIASLQVAIQRAEAIEAADAAREARIAALEAALAVQRQAHIAQVEGSREVTVSLMRQTRAFDEAERRHNEEMEALLRHMDEKNVHIADLVARLHAAERGRGVRATLHRK